MGSEDMITGEWTAARRLCESRENLSLKPALIKDSVSSGAKFAHHFIEKFQSNFDGQRLIKRRGAR